VNQWMTESLEISELKNLAAASTYPWHFIHY